MGADDNFYALDAATGKEKWKMTFARGYGSCESTPVVRGGTVYVNGSVVVTPADANRAAVYSRQLFALDAATGKERWRYRVATAPSGACLEQPIVTADTLFAVSEATLYAVDLATGRDRWKPTEVRATVEGRDRAQAVFGLVDADQVLIGLTKHALLAFDKTSGKTAWQVPGQYRENSPSTAVSGRVLYFQGHPGAKPADEVQGRILYVGGKPSNRRRRCHPANSTRSISTRARSCGRSHVRRRSPIGPSDSSHRSTAACGSIRIRRS